MSEYNLTPKLYAKTISGSQELKQPVIESNREPQPFFSESGPQTKTCSVNTTWELVRYTASLSLKNLLSQILHLN